jgi:hypothetical protein
MADTTYYPFRLTETVLTDSDFGFGSGVFGGLDMRFRKCVSTVLLLYINGRKHKQLLLLVNETTAQCINADISISGSTMLFKPKSE